MVRGPGERTCRQITTGGGGSKSLVLWAEPRTCWAFRLFVTQSPLLASGCWQRRGPDAGRAEGRRKGADLGGWKRQPSHQRSTASSLDPRCPGAPQPGPATSLGGPLHSEHVRPWPGEGSSWATARPCGGHVTPQSLPSSPQDALRIWTAGGRGPAPGGVTGAFLTGGVQGVHLALCLVHLCWVQGPGLRT